MKNLATIHKITIRLRDSFAAMGVPVDLPRLETLSTLILRSMTGRARVFHGYGHIFDVAGTSGPHETIAALYHDVVYYQVDKGFPPVIERVLASFIFDECGRVRLNPDVPQEQYGFWMCLKIFGLRPGQEVSLLQGLNEFLSAVVCAQQLSALIPKKDMMKIIACIEATIPFRRSSDPSEDVIQTLQKRVEECGVTFGVTLTPQDMDAVATSAVTIANNDVDNFSVQDPADFLSHTWRLITETNITLQFPEQHLIRDYRVAIQKMHSFFCLLDPLTVFQKYKNAPKDFDRLHSQAALNIQIAVKYMEVILIGSSILEAIAHVTGGDLPMAMMMGDVRKTPDETPRMEDFLPKSSTPLSANHDATIQKLLEHGRNEESFFDMKYSPIAAYIYPRLSKHQLDEALVNVRLMFENRMTPNLFLATFAPHIIADIVNACAHISITRSERLKILAQDLKAKRRAA